MAGPAPQPADVPTASSQRVWGTSPWVEVMRARPACVRRGATSQRVWQVNPACSPAAPCMLCGV